MNAMILLVEQLISTPTGYVTGVIMALFILGYLLYSLIKPENF